MPLAPILQQTDRTWVLYEGRRLSYFGGCDYFRLSSHPQVLAAARDAIGSAGLNVAASRATTGNHALYGQLEKSLVRFFRVECALVVASGYATNLVVAQALRGEVECTLVDERSHPSVVDALTLLGGEVVRFRHRDASDLRTKVKANGRKRLAVFTDGLFSRDGSAAPLDEYAREMPSRAWLVVDDAHGAGVLGKKGGGAMEHAGVKREKTVVTISLSKAFGSYGGAILATKEMRERMIERSGLFNGNTPLPLPMAAAAMTAVQLLGRNRAWRKQMNENAHFVKAALRAAGMAVPAEPGPIIAVEPRDVAHARTLRKRLLEREVYPSLIRYPGGPVAGYYRFMISSEHTPGQLRALADALK